MAVFFNTGGGDIYAGPTKEAVIAEMRSNLGEDFDELAIEEVGGDFKMRMDDENERLTDELLTLDDAYCESLGTYCIASDN